MTLTALTIKWTQWALALLMRDSYTRNASQFVAIKRDLPVPQLPQLPQQKHVNHQAVSFSASEILTT
ncbi:MAG: hypothetical protein D6737_18190 [Chloroflexi bacterium]|nr:MAG: hypothetical protein CUN54_09390 [Phototrophicales bacterium]RMF77292.1 MAG: hypothetical protein D6737_18190 [Chloroflexota bacterium]